LAFTHQFHSVLSINHANINFAERTAKTAHLQPKVEPSSVTKNTYLVVTTKFLSYSRQYNPL